MVKRLTLTARKHLKVKGPDLFSGSVWGCEFCITDNNFFALFGEQAIKAFFKKEGKADIKTFSLTEENLDIKINRNKILEPVEHEDGFMFSPVGRSSKPIIELLANEFPNCVFLPVVEWFGQPVNSLICVLEHAHGKPVGVVKTTN